MLHRFTAIALLAPLAIGALYAQAIGYWVPGNQQAVTATAAQLPSFSANTICLKNAGASTQTVYVGASTVTTSTGYPLEAGTSLCTPINNLNQLYVIAANTGATVAWFGTNN